MKKWHLRLLLLIAISSGAVLGASDGIQTDDSNDILLYGPITFSPSVGPDVVLKDDVVMETGSTIYKDYSGTQAVDIPGQVYVASESDSATVTITELSPSVHRFTISDATRSVLIAPDDSAKPAVVTESNVTSLRIYNFTGEDHDLGYNASHPATLRVRGLPSTMSVTVYEAGSGEYVTENTTTENGVLWMTVPRGNRTVVFSSAGGMLIGQCSGYHVSFVGCVSFVALGGSFGAVVLGIAIIGFVRRT